MPRNRLKCCNMSVLLKTEPSEYSFAELERDGETVWDGVTNPQALKVSARIKARSEGYHLSYRRGAFRRRYRAGALGRCRRPQVSGRAHQGREAARPAGAAGHDQSEQAFCAITFAEAGQTLGGPSQRRAIQVPALRRKMTRSCFITRSEGARLQPRRFLTTHSPALAAEGRSLIQSVMSCETACRACFKNRSAGLGVFPQGLNGLLKNSLRAGQAYNYLGSEIMPHTFRSALLAASARFSAACKALIVGAGRVAEAQAPSKHYF